MDGVWPRTEDGVEEAGEEEKKEMKEAEEEEEEEEDYGRGKRL